MKKEDGYITVEASLVLIGFFFIVLGLLSMIRFFTAEALMHRYLTSYALELSELGLMRNELDDPEITNRFLMVTVQYDSYDSGDEQQAFRTLESGNDISGSVRSGIRREANRSKWLNYDPDEQLEKYGVADGLDGVDFSGSCLSGDGRSITIKAKYEYELMDLPLFGNLGLSWQREQSVTTGVW